MQKKVLTSDGYVSTFDKQKIIDEIRKNCKSMGVEVTEKQLTKIATNTEESIKEMKPKHLTGSLIRSVSLIEMLDLGLEDVYKACAKIGMPIADMMAIWQVDGDSVHDNANLDGENQETQHKHIADKMCKEAMLTVLPSDLAKCHIEGGIHVHDGDYFFNRQFCFNSDMRFILYYGLYADGSGKTLPVARAAQSAEVAFLHCAKALGSSQANCAGGQGWNSFNVLISPYLHGKTYDEIKQLAQMFIYEMGQMTCARGGQSVSYNTPIVIKKNDVIEIISIGDFVSMHLEQPGSSTIDDIILTPSLNRITNRIEWKPITHVYKHIPKSKLVTTLLHDGRSVTTTEDHSLFDIDQFGNIHEISPSNKPRTIVAVKQIPVTESITVDIPDTWNKIRDILPMEVKSIELTEPEEFVFDIGVQDNENFVLANGIVAHNSVFSSIQLYPGVPQVWWNRPVVYKGQVWDGKPRTHKTENQTTYKWCFCGKTGDGRLFFNRREIVTESVLEPKIIPRKTYGQFDREARLLFKAFMEIYTEGDIRGRPFSFPKAEVVFSREFMDSPNFDTPIIRRGTEWFAPSYKELYQAAIKLALINGTPYFESQYHEENPLNSISCVQCLPGSEKIPIFRDGKYVFVPIEDLQIDDEVLTPTGKSHFRDILAEEYKGNLIQFGKGPKRILVTPNHTMITTDGTKLAKNVKIGDVLISQVTLPETNPLDPRVAYVAGVFAGNGFARNLNNSYRVEFTFNSDDQNVAERVEKYIFALIGEHGTIAPAYKKNAIRLRYYKKAILEFFENLGCFSFNDEPGSTHAHEKLVPSAVFEATANAKFAFLMGYLHADGSIVMNKHNPIRIQFTTVSENLSMGVQLLCQSLGIYVLGAYTKNNEFSKHQRIVLNINKKQDIKNFLGCQAQPNTRTEIPVRHIEEVTYDGIVFDPIDVNGHEFVLGNGYIVGNCCAYAFALSEEETAGFNNMMDFVEGSHFDSLGSMQVVSLNLPRAAYVALDSTEEDKFMAALKYLRERIDDAVRIFEIKKAYIAKQASPFMRQQVVDPNDPTKKSPVFCDLGKLTYVIGMVGLNEFVQALTGMQLHESEDAVVMGERLIGSLNLYCGKVGHENGMSIALARTPAETTAQRFAVQDLIKYPKHAKKYVKGNIKEAIKMLPTRRDVPIQYSNGTHLAVDAPVTLDKKIEIEGRFFGVLKGGNIFHVFLDDVVPMLRASELGTSEIHPSYVDDAMEFVFKIFRETPINYLAITKDSTICDDCNSITPGVNEKCPRCGSTNVDFFSRITGYLEPISQWNAAKKQEFFDRHRYGEKDVRG